MSFKTLTLNMVCCFRWLIFVVWFFVCRRYGKVLSSGTYILCYQISYPKVCCVVVCFLVIFFSSFAEYGMWCLGIKEDDRRRNSVWNAITSYLFLRTSEKELLESLKGILKDVVRENHKDQDVAAFLSEFRQRRSEYFAWNWDQADGLTEVNRQDYIDWKENYSQKVVQKGDEGLQLTPTIWNHFVDHKYDILIITSGNIEKEVKFHYLVYYNNSSVLFLVSIFG